MTLLFGLLLALSFPPQHTIEAKGVLRDYSHPKHAGVELDDHLFVIKGAYNDRNVTRIAQRTRRRSPGKPIRYFSFSHIHGQYIGGVRTYVNGGARVVTTPTCA